MAWLFALFFLGWLFFIIVGTRNAGMCAGIVFFSIGFVASYGALILQDVNSDYAAAHRQEIVITTTRWLGDPVVVQPCSLKLEKIGDGNNTKLVLPGTVHVVTPEMLNAICGKKA